MDGASIEKVKEFLVSKDWEIVASYDLPPRERVLCPSGKLPLSAPSKKLLKASYKDGIYGHQKEAIEQYLAGKNICMTTGTASGKSLAFNVAAVEELARDNSAKILAIYPLKALGTEQEQRWRKALSDAGLGNLKVGRIDGSVLPISVRTKIIRESSVLVMTPDVIHAWLLSNLHKLAVTNFISHIKLIVVDELHTYTGVFGSNAAFLYRRLRHVMQLAGAETKYFCASATIASPENQLDSLFGAEFKIIDQECDTSPKHKSTLALIEPPSDDILKDVPNLLQFLASKTEAKFLAFVDSRKQTEHITSIIVRMQEKKSAKDADGQTASTLKHLNILPYRAGYEEDDRKMIQDWLASGLLSGVVSTSALELGIDIPHLDCGILIGVPRSATSLYQRIGRVGRHADGLVMVVNSGDIYDDAIFRNPESILERPLIEPALYLENQRIQYIHALCLASRDGENDKARAAFGHPEEEDVTSSVPWPQGFLGLCEKERIGQVPKDLQGMKMEAAEDPNHTFPLRDVESQFKVTVNAAGDKKKMGGLSHAQLMREAYPGAVYYYLTNPFRVCKVDIRRKDVQVRPEKRYTTSPQKLPTTVYPDMSEGNVYRAYNYGEIIAVECSLQVSVSLTGYKERRGMTETTHSYPLDFSESGLIWDQPRFTRNYFTTGVVIYHPVLDAKAGQSEILGQLFMDAFRMVVPFERGDMDIASDRYRAGTGFIGEGSRFIALFDTTYGSLRLSGRILDDSTLEKTIECLGELHEGLEQANPDLETIIDAFAESMENGGEDLVERGAGNVIDEEAEQVIMPGSVGMCTQGSPEEFNVVAIFYNPKEGALQYRGRFVSAESSTPEVVAVAHIKEIPGVSKMGYYSLETGEATLVQEEWEEESAGE